MKKTVCILLSLFFLVCSFACAKEEPAPASSETPPASVPSPSVSPSAKPSPLPSTSPSPSASPSQSPSPSPEPLKYTNPLTGEPSVTDIAGSRPVAIMINNISTALPQLGVSKADLIYEVNVEGGITRMMAVFQNIDGVGCIGSIRSSRPYYIDLAMGLDAIYVHAGGSEPAYSRMYEYDITHIDGVNGAEQEIFFRDENRMYSLGYEHSLLTTSDLISAYFPTYGLRMEHYDGYECNMAFEDNVELSGVTAEYIEANYNNTKSTAFSYNSETGKYDVYQYGSAYYDGSNDTNVSVKNVVAIYADTYVVDDVGRLSVDLESYGSGYFATNGKIIPISWVKESCESQFEFYDENGDTITFSRGNTFISVLPDFGSLYYG